MKQLKHFGFLLVFLGTFGALRAQISYMYSDGNSNSYTVKDTEIKYEPMPKDQNSDGSNNADESKAKIISPHELNKLTILFEEAISDTTAQQKKRSSGSALLIRYNKTTVEKKVILKYGSIPITKIEPMLKSLME